MTALMTRLSMLPLLIQPDRRDVVRDGGWNEPVNRFAGPNAVPDLRRRNIDPACVQRSQLKPAARGDPLVAALHDDDRSQLRDARRAPPRLEAADNVGTHQEEELRPRMAPRVVRHRVDRERYTRPLGLDGIDGEPLVGTDEPPDHLDEIG